jgi:heme/copper-type cytochrome/quinol oxidase subunit 2
MSLASFSLVLGVLCYVFGFPLVFGDEKHVAWRKKMMNDDNMLRVFGAVFLALSVSVLKYQYRVTPDGEGLMVALAWVTFVKSAIISLCPGHYSAFATHWMDMVYDNSHLQAFLGFMMVLFGALFTYLGLMLA